MANPLSKVLSRKFNSTALGLATLMHCPHALLSHAVLVVPKQLREQAGHVILGRVRKSSFRKLKGSAQERVFHRSIIRQIGGAFYSWFPAVVFVHVATVKSLGA